jgi:nicotinamide-nucleotide amidase
MPSAEILTIGTELLLGEIQDTNTYFLARFLRDLGIDLYRTTMIGDNEERIAQAIREATQRCQILITTGGLGPTVDDPTRAAVALALGVETEFRPELWDQIQARFQRYGRQPSENNRRQAYIPKGSIPVENPVGTAPSFIAEAVGCSIISLPGVPREMEYLLQNAVVPYLRERYGLRGTIKARVLHIAGVGESTIDEWIGDLETSSNPSVGLLAHPGQVDIRITAKAESIEQADQMIAEMESLVMARIPEGFFGADRDTLESVLQQRLQARGWSLALVECGLNGSLLQRISRSGVQAQDVELHPAPCSMAELHQHVERFLAERQAQAALGISLLPDTDKHWLYLVIHTPDGVQDFTRSFGGERALSNPWSINTGLEMLRRSL